LDASSGLSRRSEMTSWLAGRELRD
jgi:hypothetical protein